MARLKKADCERVIRSQCSVWAKEVGFEVKSGAQPSFLEFKDWLSNKGFSHYLNFRSTMGADYDSERWFDEELKQTWRR